MLRSVTNQVLVAKSLPSKIQQLQNFLKMWFGNQPKFSRPYNQFLRTQFKPITTSMLRTEKHRLIR